VKAAVRAEIRRRFHSLSTEARTVASAAAMNRLRSQPLWDRVHRLAAFAPRADELDIEPLLIESCRSGRSLYLPRWSAEKGTYHFAHVRNWDGDLVAGAFGLREPAASCPGLDNKQLDLVLVPGLGFGLGGQRLGRGKGFYDRLLPQVSGALCGVGFDWQVLPVVPVELHDQRLDYIVTPTRWIACGPRAV
jgi:5-formyltetrahydrofolate cyclo-ligase